MLESLDSIRAVRREVAEARSRGSRVGLVPTMGALHEGHVRLIQECRRRAELVVVSIFVNPTQFGPSEDLEKYPRTLADDLVRCEAAGAGVVFVPREETIYPHGRDATFVEVPGLSSILEGVTRPGHFRGVATVVAALLQIVGPDVAVFGQKDYQQQALIRRMVEDLHIPVEVVVAATVREPDGLAMSSRNRYLDPAERRAATVLYRALVKARQAVEAGERHADRLRQILDFTITLESSVRRDYTEIADAESLERLVVIEPNRRAVGLVAARVGATRLIDNLLLAE